MPPTINSNKSISEASFGERSTCFWKKDGEYLCERGERARKKTAGFRSKGSPETAVKQAGQHESHEPGQEDELVAHVERHDLVDFRYVTESARIAVGVHGVDDHADDPREAEQEDHQRYGQPQGPVEKDMMFGDVSRRGGRGKTALRCAALFTRCYGGGARLLFHLFLRVHAEVPLDEVLLASKHRQRHEQLAERGGYGRHPDRGVQVEAENRRIH